jgi:hypothetical protein
MTWEIVAFIAICTTPVLHLVLTAAWRDFQDYREKKRQKHLCR